MKKFGFTIAEILITIGIIGVAAALTAPTLVNNVNVNMNMSNLSKSVNDFDNALTSAMASERTPDVFGLSFWPQGNVGLGNADNVTRFNGNFSRYMKFSTTNQSLQDIYGGGNNFYTMNGNGSKGNLWNDCNQQGTCRFRNNYPIKLSSGTIAFLQLIPRAGRLRVGQADANGNMNYITEAEAMRRGTTLRCEAGWVFFDVNGSTAPNTLGRDIFAFVIGQNGHLYPYGGVEYANFENEEIDSNNWRSGRGNYSCTNNRKSAGGMACTGRVVEEGFKITY